VAVAALVVACGGEDGGSDEGNKPDVIQDTGTDQGLTDTFVGAACHQCIVPGLSFRFTKLDVKEPSFPAELPNFLNQIWDPDIRDSRLNVVLRIKTVTPRDDNTLEVTLTAGSAWHDLTVDDVLATDGSAAIPSTYYLLEGATSELSVIVDENCDVQSTVPGFLPFHPGPNEFGLICTGGDESLGMGKDIIPLAKLSATAGRFNSECTQITGGYLEGCIRAEAACQICSFLFAPDYTLWRNDGDPQKPDTACSADYCEHHCGRQVWVNFGAFVEGIGVPQSCDADGDGVMNAYQIAGDWTADKIELEADPR
jgi:hypothetical protein